MHSARVDELSRDLVPILKPTKTHSRHCGADHVSVFTLHVPYPFDYSIVQQAALLLDAKEHCVLVLKDKRVAAFEISRSSGADSCSDDGSGSEDGAVGGSRTDIDLSYFQQDKSVRACIECLYKQFDGIRVFADRRETTDDYASLIVDGAPMVDPESFSQLLSTLTHFVFDVVVTGQRRFRLKCRFTRASRKRKRTL
jgi:hypothetical protein